MQYKPNLSREEIEENHKHFSERVLLYQKRGLDFVKSRNFILKKAHPLEGSILEIGAGTGYTTLALAKAGYKFTSIDKDKEALKIAALNIAYANTLSNVKFYVMDGISMDFEEESFKSIICVNLFHHIDRVDEMLSEIDRVLCRDGKIVLADFNRKGMETVNAVHKEEGRVHKDSKVTGDKIYTYFRDAGYEMKEYKDRCHWLLIGRNQRKSKK
jgi:ubiquinone/menaquinone biosynthesis C-methylase UbiE